MSYARVSLDSDRHNEANDCSIKAVALLLELSYSEVHTAFTQAGRKPRHGTYNHTLDKALKLLGYRRLLMPPSYLKRIIAQYPAPYNLRYKNCTTYHAQHPLFTHAWQGLPPLLLQTSGHHAAFKDGRVHDWSDNKRLRIIEASQLYPL